MINILYPNSVETSIMETGNQEDIFEKRAKEIDPFFQYRPENVKKHESYATWIEKRAEAFSVEYPVICWSLVTITVLFFVWLLIKCAWKLLKIILYQTVYR